MERRVRPALQAILEAVEGIERATKGKTLEDFSADWLLRHGVQRGIEIISDAVRRIAKEPAGHPLETDCRHRKIGRLNGQVQMRQSVRTHTNRSQCNFV